MVLRDLGNGFRAVPRDSVTLNGSYMEILNTEFEPYDGLWMLIAPNGKAIDSESGRPYIYYNFNELVEDSKRFFKQKDYSTCG